MMLLVGLSGGREQSCSFHLPITFPASALVHHHGLLYLPDRWSSAFCHAHELSWILVGLLLQKELSCRGAAQPAGRSAAASPTHERGGGCPPEPFALQLGPTMNSFWKIMVFFCSHHGLNSLYHINCFSAAFCLSVTMHSDASYLVILMWKLEVGVEVGQSI